MSKVVLIVLAGTILVAGQGFQGGLRGGVTDSAGAVIPGAVITITNEGTNATRSTITNEAGQYVFGALTPGTYKVKTELPGFKVFEQTGVMIGTQEFLIVDIRLEVGAVTESVAVAADIPLVETSNPSNGQLLPSVIYHFICELSYHAICEWRKCVVIHVETSVGLGFRRSETLNLNPHLTLSGFVSAGSCARQTLISGSLGTLVL